MTHTMSLSNAPCIFCWQNGHNHYFRLSHAFYFCDYLYAKMSSHCINTCLTINRQLYMQRELVHKGAVWHEPNQNLTRNATQKRKLIPKTQDSALWIWNRIQLIMNNYLIDVTLLWKVFGTRMRLVKIKTRGNFCYLHRTILIYLHQTFPILKRFSSSTATTVIFAKASNSE